jgi:NAD(P)-dependent dehydrogenase (short-subunit alcohol dehydrogenase family)
MAGSLEKTVALVTGSSRGIGAATARRLAANDAAVALVACRREGLDKIASAIGSDGGTVLVHARGGTRLRMEFASMWDGVAQSPHTPQAAGRLMELRHRQARKGRDRPPSLCSSHPDARYSIESVQPNITT